MRIIKDEEIPQGSQEWLGYREGKITGTKLGKLYTKSRKSHEPFNLDKPKLGLYELLAESLATGEEDEELTSSRERGHQLESEAIDLAEKQFKLKFERGGIWQDEEESLMTSPDGYTSDLKLAIEVKCLSAGRHIMAIITETPPKEYESEYLNYFLVNDKLEKLIVYLYDPRFIIPELRSHYFIIKRTDIQAEIESAKEMTAYTIDRIRFYYDQALNGAYKQNYKL